MYTYKVTVKKVIDGDTVDVDKQKIDAAHKALGMKTQTQSKGPSQELPDTNTKSPIKQAKWRGQD